MSYFSHAHRGGYRAREFRYDDNDNNSRRARSRRSYRPRDVDHDTEPEHDAYHRARDRHANQSSQYRLSKQSGYYYQPKPQTQCTNFAPVELEHGQESQEESYDSHDHEHMAHSHYLDTSSCGGGTYTEPRCRDTTRNIRDMNNWCKYVNITHSIREAFKQNGEHRINMLDLGCGKGGDLYKCRGNKKYIHKYLGIDISEECVFAARRKYERILQENIKHRNAPQEERKKFGLNNAYGQTAKEFYDGSFFDAQFICNDMTSPYLYEQRLIVQHRPFHLINIQFALHYAFQTRSALMALLRTMESATKPGSYFICSFVRDELVIKRLSEALDRGNPHSDDAESVRFQNEFQWLQMKKSDLLYIKQYYEQHNLLKLDVNALYDESKKENETETEELGLSLVGIPYSYFQRDSVEGDAEHGGGVQECFIPFAVLCKLLFKHCKMKLIYKKTASDIYIECSRKFPYRYGYSKGRELDAVKWTNDEQQVIDTYGYALFQRS